MKKCFNNVQMFKSSKDCNKFSKRFLYKNLVGGTATIGREYEQNQRLCECGANKPLTAVGTLTSLQRNSAKVVEKLFYIIAVLFSIIPSQAEAYCASYENWGIDCYDWNPGTPDNCGQGCTYNYNDGTLYITSDGSNPTLPDIFENSFYENGFPVTINRAVIDGPIKIGSNSFYLAGATISGANGNLVLNDIGHHGFGNNTVLSGNIIIPEGATFGSLAFHGVTLAEDAKIYCGVEDCAQKMIDSCNAWGDDEYGTRCLNAVNNIVSAGKVHSYPDGCTKMGASGCTKCKNSNFKLNDGECDRLRYTPAEAAEVLTDDNNNSVTITFKK
jgi:hypothetical protein